jgi:hypothetical protein
MLYENLGCSCLFEVTVGGGTLWTLKQIMVWIQQTAWWKTGRYWSWNFPRSAHCMARTLLSSRAYTPWRRVSLQTGDWTLAFREQPYLSTATEWKCPILKNILFARRIVFWGYPLGNGEGVFRCPCRVVQWAEEWLCGCYQDMVGLSHTLCQCLGSLLSPFSHRSASWITRQWFLESESIFGDTTSGKGQTQFVTS